MKIWVSGIMAWRVSNWVVEAGWVCGMGGRLVGGVMAAEMERCLPVPQQHTQPP